jgi:hypothetical protein
MSCSVEIGFSELTKDKVFFIISGCPTMKSLIATFPKGKTKFFGGDTFGIEEEGGNHYLIIEENGNLEYASKYTEAACTLPAEIASEFLAYVKERVGKLVTEEIEFKESENPQEGGKRRKTRRKKSKRNY